MSSKTRQIQSGPIQSDQVRLDDRIIVITGAGDGIGKAAALACAQRGASVILLGKTLQKLEQVYDEIIDNKGPKPAIYPMNLETATANDFEDLHTNIAEEFGRLDGLLHNAGWLGVTSPIGLYDTEIWFRVMQTNLNAPFLLTKACLPLLVQSQQASIAFTLDDQQGAYWGAYGVAKSGLTTLMQILADELESKNIAVNAYDPGPVRTKHRTMAFPAEDPSELPMPEAIVDAYIYLLSDQCTETRGKIFKPEDFLSSSN